MLSFGNEQVDEGPGKGGVSIHLTPQRQDAPLSFAICRTAPHRIAQHTNSKRTAEVRRV